MGYCVTLRDATLWIDRRKIAKYAAAGGYDSAESCLDNDESGWVFRFDRDGNVKDIDYGREKLGSDTVDMLERIGPIVRAGSFVVLEGEDGVAMRFDFDGKRCNRKLLRGGDDEGDDEGDEEGDDDDDDDDGAEHPYWGE